MSEEKKILNIDELENVTGGAAKKSGGVTYKFPDNCPECGTVLVKPRNSRTTECMQCGRVVEAVASGSWNPNS